MAPARVTFSWRKIKFALSWCTYMAICLASHGKFQFFLCSLSFSLSQGQLHNCDEEEMPLAIPVQINKSWHSPFRRSSLCLCAPSWDYPATTIIPNVSDSCPEGLRQMRIKSLTQWGIKICCSRRGDTRWSSPSEALLAEWCFPFLSRTLCAVYYSPWWLLTPP